MSRYLIPVLATLLVWWASTGLILFLDGLPRRTYRWSMAGATGVLWGALQGMVASRASVSAGGAYCAFICAILAWGWLEMTFLMGFVTGPRDTACPNTRSVWSRAVYATQAILYHEFLLCALGGAVLWLTWGHPNPVAAWTFLVLWVMRASAKLNAFLGVRNLYESFLPEHLRYLQTYFTRRPMNLLLPLSVTGGSVVAALLWRAAVRDAADPFAVTALSLTATLMSLAVLEHWFLVLPLPVEKLWQWRANARSRRSNLLVVDSDGVGSGHPAQVAAGAGDLRRVT